MENVLQQREVVGNVEDDTDEELLKQVGNVIYAVLDEFNSMHLGVCLLYTSPSPRD